MNSVVSKFDGVGADINEFISQFDTIAALNKWDDNTKCLVISAYLSGPALNFYRRTYHAEINFNELKASLTTEFPSKVNYAAAFYSSVQLSKEKPLEFLYRLEDLAHKAKIKDDATIIDRFLDGLSYYYKRSFATQLYADLKSLKNVLFQYDRVHCKTATQLNLPVKVTGVCYQQSTLDTPEVYGTPSSSRVPPIRPNLQGDGNLRTDEPACVNRPAPRYNLRRRPPLNYNVSKNYPNYQRRQ